MVMAKKSSTAKYLFEMMDAKKYLSIPLLNKELQSEGLERKSFLFQFFFLRSWTFKFQSHFAHFISISSQCIQNIVRYLACIMFKACQPLSGNRQSWKCRQNRKILFTHSQFLASATLRINEQVIEKESEIEICVVRDWKSECWCWQMHLPGKCQDTNFIQSIKQIKSYR